MEVRFEFPRKMINDIFSQGARFEKGIKIGSSLHPLPDSV